MLADLREFMLKPSYNILHCYGVWSKYVTIAMRYGLSKVEPSHSDANPFKHPWNTRQC